MTVHLDQRVDIVGVVRPGRGDQLAAGSGVGLVPAGEVAVDEVAHVLYPFSRSGLIRSCPVAVMLSITRQVIVATDPRG